MLKGSMPALVTPFTDAGAVDEAAFAAHVEWQIEDDQPASYIVH